MMRLSFAMLAAITLGTSGCSSLRRGTAVTLEELQRNKEVVRASHERVWSQGNLALADQLYTADFVCHFLVGPEWRGLQGLKERVQDLRRSFPDWTERIEEIIAEGDRVAVRFASTGTHLGEFRGTPATGKKVSIQEVAFYRIVNGRIAEQWGFPDLLKMGRQIGVKFE